MLEKNIIILSIVSTKLYRISRIFDKMPLKDLTQMKIRCAIIICSDKNIVMASGIDTFCYHLCISSFRSGNRVEFLVNRGKKFFCFLLGDIRFFVCERLIEPVLTITDFTVFECRHWFDLLLSEFQGAIVSGSFFNGRFNGLLFQNCVT